MTERTACSDCKEYRCVCPLRKTNNLKGKPMTIDFTTIKFGTLAMLDVQKSKGRQSLERLVKNGGSISVIAEIEITDTYESYDGISHLFEGKIKSIKQKP